MRETCQKNLGVKGLRGIGMGQWDRDGEEVFFNASDKALVGVSIPWVLLDNETYLSMTFCLKFQFFY